MGGIGDIPPGDRGYSLREYEIFFRGIENIPQRNRRYSYRNKGCSFWEYGFKSKGTGDIPYGNTAYSLDEYGIFRGIRVSPIPLGKRGYSSREYGTFLTGK